MNTIDNKQIDWNKVEGIIKSSIEQEFPYINVLKMNSLQGALNNGAASLNLSLDRLVTGVLRDKLCIIHINCVDLLSCKDSGKLYKYNKEAKAFFEFLKEIGFELNAEVHLVKNTFSFNEVRNDKSASHSIGLEDVFSAFKSKGFTADNTSLNTMFSGDLKEFLTSIVNALVKPIIDNIIFDMAEVRKIVDEVIYRSSKTVEESENIFIKEELTA